MCYIRLSIFFNKYIFFVVVVKLCLENFLVRIHCDKIILVKWSSLKVHGQLSAVLKPFTFGKFSMKWQMASGDICRLCWCPMGLFIDLSHSVPPMGKGAVSYSSIHIRWCDPLTLSVIVLLAKRTFSSIVHCRYCFSEAKNPSGEWSPTPRKAVCAEIILWYETISFLITFVKGFP